MTQEKVGREMEMLAEWPCFVILSDPGHPGTETCELGALYQGQLCRMFSYEDC